MLEEFIVLIWLYVYRLLRILLSTLLSELKINVKIEKVILY